MAAILLPSAGDIVSSVAQQPPEALTQPLLPSEHPLVLLPVRLETRFFANAAGQELRIRVFPDQIHIDAHEGDLSRDEHRWGAHFWEQTWRAGNDEAAQRRAWQQLADRFDARRAAWIARVLEPTNPAERPTSPLAEGAALSPKPKLADARVRDDDDIGWRRAPVARLMPQRWVAVAKARGQIVGHAFGGAIASAPAVGPDPDDDTEAADDDAAVDPGMRWLVDFDEAERAGMALRMPLTVDLAQAGIDVLLVFGVDATLDEAASAKALSDLLDAHRYTDGLEFLRTGTPTNNTADAPSGYTSSDPMHVRSFDSERRAPAARAGDDSHADVLARAFGFDARTLAATMATLRDASLREGLDARRMAAALWPATWGYYLTNLIDVRSTPLTLDDIAWARRHFIDHVSAFGPLPALRIGRQPYGVLPVTALGEWSAKPGGTPAGDAGGAPGAGAPGGSAGDASAVDEARAAWLQQTLLKMRDRLWRPRLPDVPRIGRSTDPDQDLATVLRTDALATSYRVRHVLGAHYLQHLRRFIGEDLVATGWSAAQDELTTAVLQALGFAWRPRLAGAAYDEAQRNVTAPRVQARRPETGADADTDADLDGGSAKLEPNYIAALLADPPVPVREADSLPTADPATLLHLLLRHATQLEYAAAAARLLSAQADGPALASLVRDAELVNLDDATAATTWRMQLGRPDAATDGKSPGQWLKELEGAGDFQRAELTALREFRDALAHLQSLPRTRLERLLVGTLDLASHRLDAWITSFATRRLAAMRGSAPTGVRVGACGWVMNLKPQPAPETVPTPAGETGPMQALRNDPGFIHAPSITQAQTAALLRNAHLTHSRGDAQDVFAVDLSSRRVRIATWLLDGVRQGQPLGALLGYRFERALHEQLLDDCIDDFRLIAPLKVDGPAGEGAGGSAAADPGSIAARNVVDGLRLHEIAPARAGEPLFVRCAAPLAMLAEAVDAVGDAVLAEAAFQAVRGNTALTAATLQAVASGEMPPPELDVARTPRSGAAVTHRVVVLLEEGVDAESPAAATPRTLAEPRLAAWAGKLIGAAKNVRFAVEHLDVDGRVAARHESTLADLRLSPLDAVYLAPQPGGSMTELEHLLLHGAHKMSGVLRPGESLRIEPQSQPGWRPNDIGLRDLRELASRARQLFAGARALDARDLAPLERSVASGLDAAEFEARAKRAAALLASATEPLRSLLDEADTGNVTAAALGNAMLELLPFGIAGAVPFAGAAAGPGAGAGSGPHGGLESAALETLVAQATAVAREARQRSERANSLQAKPDADPEQRCAAAAARMRAIFGGDFLALPRFANAAAEELAQSLAASRSLQGGDALAVCAWFQRAQRVRDGVSRLGASLHAAEAVGSREALRLRVAQLPHTAGDRWIGLPSTPTKPLATGRVSLVVQGSAPPRADAPLCGLLVDEWVEVVPSASETTAITFQYDAPDMRAPQSLLVAVPPVPGEPWTAWSLHRVLLETLDLAMLRAVDAEALDVAALNPVAGAQSVGEVAHFLPALFFAVNVDGDAVSPDFGPLTA